MNEDCVFCKMVSGKIPVKKIYESDHFFAILDNAPLIEGHALLIPKRHYNTIHDMNAEERAQVGEDMHALAEILKKEFGDHLTITNSNGKYASQEVPHYHIHFVPRKKDDRLWEAQDKSRLVLDKSSGFPRLNPPQEELAALANKLTGDTQ